MLNLEESTNRALKRLLSVDCGGIRGVLSFGILRQIRAILKAQVGGRDGFRSSHYFDYVGGTSTGGIIAAGLSAGMWVDDMLAFHKEAGAQVFVKANLLQRLRYEFESEPLAEKLKGVFGAATEFGSDRL